MTLEQDREVFAAFRQHLVEPGWVAPATQKLLDQVIDWRMGDRDSITELASQIEGLVSRVEELFLSLDAALKFTVEPLAESSGPAEAGGPDYRADLRGVACPLNFVKAKIELEKIPVGQTLEFILDAGEPARNVPGSFAQQGQEVLEVKENGEQVIVTVRRDK